MPCLRQTPQDEAPVRHCRKPRGWRFAAGGLILLALGAAALRGQSPGAAHPGPSAALPATTGEPLTIAPTDLPDIDCTIHEWNPKAQKPMLTLLCPPQQVFAPLRVYLKLTWLRLEDVPREASRIVAEPRQATRLRTRKNVVLVRLDVAQEKGRAPQAKWVAFTGVEDVALIQDARR